VVALSAKSNKSPGNAMFSGLWLLQEISFPRRAKAFSRLSFERDKQITVECDGRDIPFDTCKSKEYIMNTKYWAGSSNPGGGK
jgi:hypothetical protein